jgi:hypothetical protein
MATIPSRKATFTEEEKRKLVEGTDAQGKPLSESEKMKLSKMHTARTLGADWRERAAERMKAEEPARAQQALAERAAINRSAAPREFKLPTKADEEMDIPGGGKVKIGAETLKRMQGFEKQRSEAKAAEDVRKQNLIYDAGVRANTALQKRYEDELASRGFAPPKTRQEAEAISRARSEEFRLGQAARTAAERKEKETLTAYKDYKGAARYARKNKDYARADEYEELANQEEMMAGGDIRNASLRKRFFQDKESEKLRQEIDRRSEERRAVIKKQNTSNPEASVSGSGYKDYVAGVNQESPFLTYQNIAGIYGKGANPFSKYAKKPKAPRTPEIGASQPRSQKAAETKQTEITQDEWDSLTPEEKDEIISGKISRGLKETGKSIYSGGKAAFKAILEGARAIR